MSRLKTASENGYYENTQQLALVSDGGYLAGRKRSFVR